MTLARQGQDAAVIVERASVCFRTLIDLLNKLEKGGKESTGVYNGGKEELSKAQHFCNYAVFLAYIQVCVACVLMMICLSDC
jgi:hypothetical protein